MASWVAPGERAVGCNRGRGEVKDGRGVADGIKGGECSHHHKEASWRLAAMLVRRLAPYYW